MFNLKSWKSPMSAHGQWIWYSFSVIAAVHEGQEIQSPGGQICSKQNHSSSEPCSDFSDSPLKARCSEHNILAATHCFGFWNETVLPNTSWPDLVLLSDPHPFPVQKKNDSFTMLNFQWLNKKSNTKFILYNSYHNPPKTWNNPNKN